MCYMMLSIVSSFQACHRHAWVLFCSSHIPAKCFELMENKLYEYADDSTLLAVVRKPADKPAVATSLDARDTYTVLSYTERWSRYTEQMLISDRQMISWPATLKTNCVRPISALLLNNHK